MRSVPAPARQTALELVMLRRGAGAYWLQPILRRSGSHPAPNPRVRRQLGALDSDEVAHDPLAVAIQVGHAVLPSYLRIEEREYGRQLAHGALEGLEWSHPAYANRVLEHREGICIEGPSRRRALRPS